MSVPQGSAQAAPSQAVDERAMQVGVPQVQFPTLSLGSPEMWKGSAVSVGVSLLMTPSLDLEVSAY